MMSEARNPREYLAYCGLYCGMCSLVATLPGAAETLRGYMKDDGWELYGNEVFPGFDTFWDILTKISNLAQTSPLCVGGCGDPDCGIRKCAVERGLEVCAQCDDFPCEQLSAFTRRYPFVLKNNERIREIGLDAWLAEQSDLVAQGVTNRSLCAEQS